jgi:hypothetical protein
MGKVLAPSRSPHTRSAPLLVLCMRTDRAHSFQDESQTTNPEGGPTAELRVQAMEPRLLTCVAGYLLYNRVQGAILVQRRARVDVQQVQALGSG